MEVKPLLSGRSGAVSGEVSSACQTKPFLNSLRQISFHPGPCVDESEFQSIPRSAAVQYRLTDTGAVFFERGTGGGVL